MANKYCLRCGKLATQVAGAPTETWICANHGVIYQAAAPIEEVKPVNVQPAQEVKTPAPKVSPPTPEPKKKETVGSEPAMAYAAGYKPEKAAK